MIVLGTWLGVRRLVRDREPRSARRGPADEAHWHGARSDALDESLCASGIPLERDEVEIAAATAAAVALAAAASGCVAVLLLAPGWLMVMLVASIVVPLAAREVVMDHPERSARRKAGQLAREAPEGTNLMIMSIRHEPSLSNSIGFASTRRNAFSEELRACVWRVLIGRNASFEESLQQLGSTWERYCPDLKAAMNAMITASCERTEDGKRRALDRASHAIVAGTKRRIEEYALSLSFPSMLLFGVGILLPLMVGSFMPMTSWGMWSYDAIDQGAMQGGEGTALRTALVMNVVFPSVALIVALGAVSRHPLERGGDRARTSKKPWLVRATVTASISIAACLASIGLLEGTVQAFAVLMSVALPLSAALTLAGRGTKPLAGSRKSAAEVEDILFRTGASMVEGENFESALNRSARGVGDHASMIVSSLALGRDHASTAAARRAEASHGNAAEALRLVADAAGKDEQSAGLLAMDLAAYLRDLRDLESTLKNRLRPTISMMKTTAYALGPVVMGITFAIYLSLTSIVAPGAQVMDAGTFFLILGVFLLEVNLVVTYFVWGIEGEGDLARMLRSAGYCTLCSSMVFSTSALLAS